MPSLKRLFTSFIVLNILIISFASADTPPEFPFMALSGNVIIDGKTATLGTIITAFIVDDSDPTTSDGVANVNENGEYAMLLDDVSEEDEGKEIIFMVDGFIAEQNSIYLPQGEEFLDLTFTIPPFPIDEIITPMDKEFVSTNTPLFEWTETTDPNSDVFYILLISNKEDFSNIIIEQEVTEPTYTLNDKQALEEGTYYLMVIATDGFSYIPAEEISFTVDITLPTLETIEINGGKELNNLIYFSPANNDGNYDTIDILLSADEPVMYNRLSIINESGKEVKYFFQTSEFSEDIVKTWEGGFTNTPPPYVPDGKYIIETKIEDRAGNTNTIHTAEIVVDNTPPIISNEITRTLDGRELIYNDDDVYLNASIVDELSNVSAVLLEGNWWRDSTFANITLTSNGNGNYSYILESFNLENGEIVDWRYYANDSLGNFGQGNFNTFIVEDREPIFTGTIPDLIFFEDGDAQQIELSKYFSDLDIPDDLLTYTPTTLKNYDLEINQETGITTIKPNRDYNGTDTVIFTAADKFGKGVDSNLVTITVININEQPIGFFPFTTITFDEDKYNNTIDLDDFFEDVDGTIVSYTYTKLDNSENISIKINPVTNIVNISSAENWYGTGKIYFSAIDNEEGVGNSNVLTIKVTPINDIPIISGIPVIDVPEDTDKSIDLSTYTFDVETSSAEIIYRVIESNEEEIKCSIKDNVFLEIKPQQNFVGENTCIVQANDTINTSEPFTIIINVLNGNDAPVITSTPITNAIEDELYIYEIKASDVDTDAVTYELLTKPSGMGINPQGIIGWTPTNDNVGDNNVVVRVKDIQSAFAEQSFVINVANVNDPPSEPKLISPLNQSTILTNTATLKWELSIDIDPTKQQITYNVYQKNESTNFSLTGTTTLTEILAQNLAHDNKYFWYVNASDGIDSVNSGRFTYTVSLHNPPKISAFTPLDINLNLVEDSSTLFNVVAEDLDTPPDLPLSYEWMFDEDIVSRDDTFQYKAGFNDSGLHKISVSVNDTTGMKTKMEWNLNVNNTNRNPDFYMVFVEDINEDERAVFELIGNDEDAQFGDRITYSVNDSRVTINRINDTSANATLIPTNDDVGTHQFNFTARDEFNGEISKIIQVNVLNTNDAPVIKTYYPQVDKLIIAENERVEFNISFEDADKNDQDQVTWYLNQNIVETGANKSIVENLQEGKYTVNVTVEDISGDKLTRTWELIVSDTPVSSLYTGSIFNILEENLGNATNVTINQSSFGVIDFGSQELNLSDVVDIDNNVIISKGVVGINTEKYSQLNKSAQIFMNGLGFAITPKILYNKGFGIAGNTECPADLCSNVIYNVTTGTLRFNVVHFSTFFVQQGNTQPIANAGQDLTINVNNLVTLDGSASIDIDKDALRFNWTQISGDNVTLSNATVQKPTFTPTKVGVYAFRLIVNDGTLDSLSDDVTITATENVIGKVLDITDVEVESDGKDEELKPGEKLKVSVEIANKGDVDIKDITLKVFFKSKSGGTLEDDDGDEVEDESEFDLDEGDDEDDLDEDDVTFTFDMPFDVDDGDKFIAYVTAEGIAGNDSSLKFSDIDSSETIEFVREKHEISIFRASINPITIKCERTINVNLGIKNIGEEDEDVVLSFSASELGISEKQEFSLESDPDADENTFTRAFSYNIPENIDSGIYTIPVNVEFDDGSETDTTQLSLTVENCEKQSVKKKPITEDVGLKVVPKKEEPKEEVIFYPIKSPEKKVVTEVKFTDTSTYLVLLASSFIIITLAIVALITAYVINGRRR